MTIRNLFLRESEELLKDKTFPDVRGNIPERFSLLEKKDFAQKQHLSVQKERLSLRNYCKSVVSPPSLFSKSESF